MIAMRFYTKDECEEWLRGRDRVRPDQTAGVAVERIGYPPEPHKFFYFAHWIATSMTYRMPTLLWITEWSIGQALKTGICITDCAKATVIECCYTKPPDTSS